MEVMWFGLPSLDVVDHCRRSLALAEIDDIMREKIWATFMNE
jgi:hypothetical protein